MQKSLIQAKSEGGRPFLSTAQVKNRQSPRYSEVP